MGRPERSQRGSCFLMAEARPGLGRPVCIKNPPGYSIMDGCEVASRGRRLSGLVTKAPKESREMPLRGSGENPNDPAAFMRGLLKYKSRFILLFLLLRGRFLFFAMKITTSWDTHSGSHSVQGFVAEHTTGWTGQTSQLVE